MTYNPNVPQANDLLSNSQVNLLTNFGSANTSFGVNHYPFSDLTINNGKHNNIQTPLIVGGVHPATPANEDAFYGMQDSVPLGVLQYSRGPNSPVPTPLTSFQSTAAAIVLAPGATTNLLDFTGLARAFCMVYATDTIVLGSTRLVGFVIWTGTVFSIITLNSGIVLLNLVNAGNVLQLKNNSGAPLNNVYWSMQFLRIQ